MEVIPDTAYRIAPKSFNQRKIPILILGLPVGAVILALNEPSVLFVLVPLWLWGAWRLGECAHCGASDEPESDEEDEDTEEDAPAI